MKKILAILCLAGAFLGGCALSQDASQSKDEQKKANDAERQLAYEAAVSALEAGNFVVEAERVSFKRGETAYLSSNVNFISVEDGNGVVQLAFNTSRPTPNGIGGITVEGKVSSIKMEKSKKGTLTYSYYVQGIGISAQITIQLPEGTNQVTAVVNPNFNSNRITLFGTLLPIDESNIFKGRSF